ncbi:hydroxymethylglutaryl-CoA lyase [Ahrensia marina]|uniref:hydroxymethylglutaryl-CoA lyase n=1 Tax=Ahrensia marina TaxID=1514904 RepID=A0A0N0E8R3_9HYPH|nr:hydroxymethylglutaryl-CoA lyase [Ahrensia marina]KPB02655.1 hydroxymethylglutaryl-CoA lyase [Ahrensia marina]
MMDKVRIYEVGPRDGLQNEKTIVPTQTKVALIDLLSNAGFSHIEATSFVPAKWVPQMADAAEVLNGITRAKSVIYAALTPNIIGYEKAHAAKADEVAIFAAASETFSQKNINCSIAESIERFVPVIERARADNIPVRGYVSCVVGCPYEGEIDPEAVAKVAAKLLDLGCYEISLGDTIGSGTPAKINAMLKAVKEYVPAEQLAGHYHDTNGNALDNVKASLAEGLRTFDSAIGGLGGCPYAPGAKGNVSTVKLAQMLDSENYYTGLDFDVLAQAETLISTLGEHHDR